LSSAEIAANFLKMLEDRDLSILYALERSIDSFKELKINHIGKLTTLHQDEVNFRLLRLQKMKMISKGESGYYLATAGLDAMVLKAFVNNGLISAFGGNIGVGKEADVFEAIDEKGSEHVIKFYRLGRISFRGVKKKRNLLPSLESSKWLKACINAAGKEFYALKQVHLAGGKVPEAIARERHAILMQKIDGTLLCKTPELQDPLGMLEEILDTLRTAFFKVKIVNGDLSEYNVLYNGKNCYVIDWPQAVEVGKFDSERLLKRDVENIVRFFKRKYQIEYSFDKAYDYVTK
jgi:RIO kinase 2